MICRIQLSHCQPQKYINRMIRAREFVVMDAEVPFKGGVGSCANVTANIMPLPYLAVFSLFFLIAYWVSGTQS